MAKLTTERKSILALLAEGPVIGDGSYVWTLEYRGYVTAGVYTPEAVIEHPTAVYELHKEFLRAGSDCIQVFNFYAGFDEIILANGDKTTNDALNEAAFSIADQAAGEYGALTAAGFSPTSAFRENKNVKEVKKELNAQLEAINTLRLDFLLGEFFDSIEEAEWAVEAMKARGVPIAFTMRIGPTGDCKGVTPGECAVRLAKAGADIVGINCCYDPETCIEVIKEMKAALEENNLKAFLMLQPAGFILPEVKYDKKGFYALPECPLAMESRTLTRFDARNYAREAYKAGVRYFGGCCGFQPHHIREMADELKKERGRGYPAEDHTSSFGAIIATKEKLLVPTHRSTREYWQKVKPGSGRSVTSGPTNDGLNHQESQTNNNGRI